MPPRGAPGLTRLDRRSKQSLFSLVPKLMMPWRGEVQRQGEHDREGAKGRSRKQQSGICSTPCSTNKELVTALKILLVTTYNNQDR